MDYLNLTAINVKKWDVTEYMRFKYVSCPHQNISDTLHKQKSVRIYQKMSINCLNFVFDIDNIVSIPSWRFKLGFILNSSNWTQNQEIAKNNKHIS